MVNCIKTEMISLKLYKKTKKTFGMIELID